MAGSDPQSDNRLRVIGATALITALLAILVASLWLAGRTWVATADAPMSIHGYIAMTLGVVFSLVVGCGLMALVFYSSRHGYDEESGNPQYRIDRDDK
jgi:heme/copper-type cytochrome/quinol oxidase subunit 2